MADERRKYTKDYKEAAVAMAEREDKTVRQAARELGINASILTRGRSELWEAREGETRAFPGNGNPRDEELVRLRKRVAELRYGAPRLQIELRKQGGRVSRKRIGKLLRKYGLNARRKRRYMPTTQSNHGLPAEPGFRGNRGGEEMGV
jgi:transposase